MRNDAVDSADFDAGADALGAVGEDGTSSMRMGQDEETLSGVGDGDFARVVRPLRSLSATGASDLSAAWTVSSLTV